MATSADWYGFVFMRQQWNGYSTLAFLRRLKETTGISYNFVAPLMYKLSNFSKLLPGKWDIFVDWRSLKDANRYYLIMLVLQPPYT